MIIKEVRKEDDLYFQGPFWIIANSFAEIHRNNFRIIGQKFLCNHEGDYLDDTTKKSQKTHKSVWKRYYEDEYQTEDYTFYPRGRVAVYQGTAFIHINSKCNLPEVIDAIVNEYSLTGLNLEIDENDTYQGSHYHFKLK